MAIQLSPPLGAPQPPGQSNLLQQLMQLLGGNQSIPAQRGPQLAQNDFGVGNNPVLQINPLANTPMMQRGGAAPPQAAPQQVPEFIYEGAFWLCEGRRCSFGT